jgi:thiamine-phosphate pyrophosphorylase
MLLYAITSRSLLSNTEAERTERLVALAAQWTGAGLDFIQIRETDLADADLLHLTTGIVQAVRRSGNTTRVLVNGSPTGASTIARQAGAGGVHLPSGLDPEQLAAAVAQIHNDWDPQQGSKDKPAISVSCHSTADVIAARAARATLALFAPVIEKALPGTAALGGQGLDSLAEACAAAHRRSAQPELPVLALGGVTLENAAECVAAGAAGIAAIRLFLNFEGGQDWRLLLSERSRQVPVPP